MLFQGKGDEAPSICQLPPKTGKCRAKIKRYYFNPDSGTCESFFYGGCNGNKNNFQTLKQCQQQCKRKWRERDRETERQRGTDRERQRQREERDRDREKTETETDRDREGEVERETETETKRSLSPLAHSERNRPL